MIPEPFLYDSCIIQKSQGSVKNGGILETMQKIFRMNNVLLFGGISEIYTRRRPGRRKNFANGERISCHSENPFVESCRKGSMCVAADVFQRFCSPAWLAKNAKKARKCAGASENPAQACADFLKRAKKRYNIHT